MLAGRAAAALARVDSPEFQAAAALSAASTAVKAGWPAVAVVARGKVSASTSLIRAKLSAAHK